MIKTKAIEDLLVWAFVHELPKGGGVDGLDNANSAWRMIQASSWGKVLAYGELGAMIDSGRRDNYFIEQGEPHSDALALGEAVAALAGVDIAMPGDWAGLGDWEGPHGLAHACVERTVERFMLRPWSRRAAHLVSLVVGTAVLGRQPDWRGDEPKVRMVEVAGRPAWFLRREVRDDFGRSHVLEVDGMNPRAGRPHRGAYRKYEYSDDPAHVVLSRLDWQLWVAALERLADMVRPKLTEHTIGPSEHAGAWPWLPDCGSPAIGLTKKLRKAA